MNRSGWRSHLTALLTALIACVGLLSLSSLPTWAVVGTLTEFSPASLPRGITAGPDGNLWFAESNNIGRITPNGSITEFPTPTKSSGPWSITTGPDSNLWFTEEAGNQIGRITPAGSITEFPLPTNCGLSGGCEPWSITSGPDGNLWFTLFIGNSIVRLTPSGSFTGAFHTPTKTSRPYGITVGPDGNLWFTEYIGNKIGRLSMQ